MAPHQEESRDQGIPPADVAPRSRADVNADRIERLLEDLDAAHDQLGRYRRELADAREAIATERARFRELFEISREGHVVTTSAGMIVECNQAAAALLNRPAEYLVGKPLAGYVTPEHRRGFRVRLYRAGTAGAAEEWTTTVEHPDLPQTEVSISVTPVVDERGAVEMLRWLIRDVSNARAGLVALREPGAVMRAALDALSAHIAVLDTEGGIVTVNRAWQDAVA